MTNDPVAKTIATYDEMAALSAARQEQKLMTEDLDAFIKLVPPASSILDLGCGSGRDTAYFHEHGFAVLGVDLSQGMLDEARRLHPEILLRKMDMRQLDMNDESLEGVWARASLLHLPKTDVVVTLKEIFRILKPGGIFFVSVKEKEIAAATAKQIGGRYRYYSYYDQAEFAELLTETGFDIFEQKTTISTDASVGSEKHWLIFFAKKN